MKKCFYCGQKTEDGRTNVNNPNEFVCDDCWVSHPRCSSCNNLLEPGKSYYQKSNGNKLCTTCNLVEEKSHEKKKGEGKYWLGIIVGAIIILIFVGIYYSTNKSEKKYSKRRKWKNK